MGDLDGEGYLDIGLSGQGVIQGVVALYLRGLEFNETGRPSIMRPAPLIKVDPLVQARHVSTVHGFPRLRLLNFSWMRTRKT